MADHTKILIHIGTHKTGSTSFQRLCARASDQLLDDGILYPESGRPNHLPNGHHILAWSMHQARGYNDLEGWDAVTDEIQTSNVPKVVLSSEGFVRCTVSEIQRIRSFFPDCTVQALVYLRAPFSYMVSLYKTHITGWSDTRSFRSFAADLLHRCDYQALLRRWEEGLGEQAKVRSFDVCRKNDRLEASFLDVLGVEASEYEQFMEEPANVSPSEEQVLTARWLNRLQSRDWSPDWLLQGVKRNVLRGNRRGCLFARAVQALRHDALYASSDVDWFDEQMRKQNSELAGVVDKNAQPGIDDLIRTSAT